MCADDIEQSFSGEFREHGLALLMKKPRDKSFGDTLPYY